MSLPQRKVVKPPACDSCKARRVLCHPQPHPGAPCPRCAEKGIQCKTTYVSRGRPRKNALPYETQTIQLIQPAPSSITLLSPQVQDDFGGHHPELTPAFVAHMFECFDRLPQVVDPIFRRTSIKASIRTVSYQLHLLPTQARVLALCIIAYCSLTSFDEAVLGPGLRPQSFSDSQFFAFAENFRSCGARRKPVCHALHANALRAAWDAGIILQATNENAASCFLLDMLEQHDFTGLSRPWASAYTSHLRALAPAWRTSPNATKGETEWAVFLMVEMSVATRCRQPMLITLEDQILLTGPESSTLETLLSSLEESAEKADTRVIFQSMKPFMFHAACLSRTLWQTITGEHTRFIPLSESAVMQFHSSLCTFHAILTHLLARVESFLARTAPVSASGSVVQICITPSNDVAVSVRGCAYVLIVAFISVALPFHRELQGRIEQQPANATVTDNLRHARLRLLSTQARDLVRAAIHSLALAFRIVSEVQFQYVPLRFYTVRSYAEFALEEAETTMRIEPDDIRDLKTICYQLSMTGYTVDLGAVPGVESLIARMEAFVQNATLATAVFDQTFVELMPQPDQAWM